MFKSISKIFEYFGFNFLSLWVSGEVELKYFRFGLDCGSTTIFWVQLGCNLTIIGDRIVGDTLTINFHHHHCTLVTNVNNFPINSCVFDCHLSTHYFQEPLTSSNLKLKLEITNYTILVKYEC